MPLFPEAMLLHHLDNLDSKMECMRALAEKDRHVEGCWTGYSASLDRSILKKSKYLEDVRAARRCRSASGASRSAGAIPDNATFATRQLPTGELRAVHSLRGETATSLAQRTLNESSSSAPSPQAGKASAGKASAGKTTAWLTVLGGVFIACFFLVFTWRGLLTYYTGDDLMNLYGYWSQPVSALVKANFFFWTPYYRPFGASSIALCSRFSVSIRIRNT